MQRCLYHWGKARLSGCGQQKLGFGGRWSVGKASGEWEPPCLCPGRRGSGKREPGFVGRGGLLQLTVEGHQ